MVKYVDMSTYRPIGKVYIMYVERDGFRCIARGKIYTKYSCMVRSARGRSNRVARVNLKQKLRECKDNTD